MNKERHNISEDVLLDYLDGMLDAEKQREVQACLGQDAALRRLCESIRAQERDLFALGQDLGNVTPSINIVDSVMRVVDGEADTAEPLEDELISLGACLRENAPAVDMVGDVMTGLVEAGQDEARTAVEQELEAVGSALRRHAPRVHIVPRVMAAVDADAREKVVSFSDHARKQAVRKRGALLSWRLVMTAAAALILTLGVLIGQLLQPPRTGEITIARRQAESDSRETVARQENGGALEREGEPFPLTTAPENGLSLLSTLIRPAAMEESVPEVEAAADAEAEFGLEDVIRARRQSLEGQADALAMLARWGALDPDEVRRLLAEGMLTPTQLAGLSRFLPGDEAAAVLREAIEQRPEDPDLRMALAKQLMESPDGHTEALQHLAALRDLAPDNAMVHYMDAQLRFSMGDYEGALSLLEYATGFNTGNTYALANAQQHSAALQAAGFSGEMADTLAAFYAGTDEYAAVSQMQSDLLAYGSYFESLGDYDTAFAIYKSVGQLGQQISRGADYTNEYLAGLDTQRAAIDAMRVLVDMIHIPGGLDMVQMSYDVFVEGLNIFLDYTSLLDTMTSVNDVSLVLNVVNSILQTGDIAYLQRLLI